MDFRQRLEQNRARTVSNDNASEPEDIFTCPYFATDRTKNPACLELRLPNGVRKALPYAYITEINYDIERGIEILSTSKRITITGRHLTQLFDYLVSYRVRYVQTHSGAVFYEEGLFVKEIMVEPTD
jgi:hypothetical protein